ncbi:uncharacterized protein LAESUDRAFT_242417 [Laetiporus sulphureus 93-53]|uniref:cAMP-independent regulatory protein pac2 n=1 Tax=Laetiporus sulphureus 93-53 TaxID=1314785 RepID=A0A165DL04_9APHY|nr:uncharacterized protein LAESUDRAFT_242417 [Laetiporus sulphureus 93-53]KZT05114.1 hypothetical protein LAESUDRAFT_242417 [Laetiporus sulphureus 93-53]
MQRDCHGGYCYIEANDGSEQAALIFPTACADDYRSSPPERLVMSPTSPAHSATSGHTTIAALHLRDAKDAHIVFEAVRLNLLPLITRRLTAAEREQLCSGNVFVWEEAEHKQGGLERWTDGRRWSQSRMRGDYLFYEEKIETTPEEKAAKAARRARRTLDPFNYQPAPTRQDRPSKPDGLTKQTYSTHVYNQASEPRKWHVVAYFCGDDYTRLPVIEDYDFLRDLCIPDGIFSSPRGNPTRVNRAHSGIDNEDYIRSDGQWAKVPWSLSSPASVTSPIDRPESSSSSSSSSTVLTSSSESTVSHHDTGSALPRLSNVLSPHHLSIPLSRGLPSPSGPPSPTYNALTSEDRRALSSFRVIL